MSHLKLLLLGAPQVESDNTPCEFDTRKALALLAYLAVTNQTHSRDALATLFWPEQDQTQARTALRYALWALQKGLGKRWFQVEREQIGLTPSDDVYLDVKHFQAQLVACRTHGHAVDEVCPACLPLLNAAIALYRGDFLAGFTLRDSPGFDDWQFFQAESLRQDVAAALERLVHGHSAQGEYAQAIPYARHWLALDPLHEPAQRWLMQVYAQAGQQAAALRQYQECVRILDEEMGAPPAAETTKLYEQIRAGVFSDKAKGRQSAISPAPQPTLAPSSPHPVILASPVTFPEETTGRTVFVARARELAELDKLLQRAVAGQGGVIFVTGEAGSGKTALLREFAQRASRQTEDLLVVSGQCNAQTSVGDPYLPFRHMLRLLTGDLEVSGAQLLLNRTHVQRLWTAAPVTLQTLVARGADLINTLVPGVALLSRAKTLTPTGAAWLAQLAQLVARPVGTELNQHDLLEQYANCLGDLAGQRPLLLLVDDLHWVDAASLNLLFHLGRQIEQHPILLVGAYRAAEVPLGRGAGDLWTRHPLEPVVHELQRTYGEIVLDLEQAHSRAFVEAWLDTQPNRLSPAFRTTLYQRTQGQPLFTVELLHAVRERGDLVRNEAGQWCEGSTLDWDTLPARIEAVIAERINRLAEPVRELLAVASVEGETFTTQVVSHVQGTGERALLQQLTRECEKRHHLVRRPVEVQVAGVLGAHWLTRCQFTHVLFQQHLYHSLSSGERRLLHGEIAAALVALYGEQTEEITVQLAYHYVEAGDWARAVTYLLQAGDRARTLYAHQEAIAAYQRALVLLKQQGDYAQAARALMKLGLTYHLAFDFRQAQHAFDEGFVLWQRAGETPPAVLPPAPHALRLNWFEPPTLDPAVADLIHSHELFRQLFSGLAGLSPELDVVPALARTWEVGDGGRTYLFHLRDDVYWSDGVPLTAEDFVYAWLRVLQPANQSYTASLLFAVKGAHAFHLGQVTDPNQVGVRAGGAHTLVVELEEPISYLPHLLTYPGTYPVPRHVVAAHGAAWTAPENIVTNGPFRLESWQRDRAMVLVRNSTYYGRFSGNVQRVELALLPEAAGGAGLARYEANELDILESLFFPLAEIDRARQRHASEYVAGPLLYTDLVAFNVRHPSFADVRVRQAFALATDRETLADVVCRGYLFPGTGGLVPPGMPGHAAGISPPYDPARARQLLAAAGYPDGRGFPLIEGLGPTGLADVGAYLQAQWRENLGVTVTWQAMAWPLLYERIDREPPMLFLGAWLADYPDPDIFLRVWPHRHRHVTGWRDETYAGLVERAGRVTDQGERMALYRQADRRLIEEAVILPLTYWRRHLLMKPWVKRFPTSPLSFWFWQDVIIEPH